MSNVISIDLDALGTLDQATVQALIKAGISTTEIFHNLIDGSSLVDDCLVMQPEIWHADDGSIEVESECETGEEAAQEYVDGGSWGDGETSWIDVLVWQEAIDCDGDICRVNEAEHTITVQPSEPACTESEHDWQSPYEILGGLKENPGVWGSGGGVIITEVCLHCGCARVTDTWAQNPSNGVRGLRKVSYEEARYADEVAAMKEEVE